MTSAGSISLIKTLEYQIMQKIPELVSDADGTNVLAKSAQALLKLYTVKNKRVGE